MLSQAQDIYILAQNRAFPVAFYLAYALGRLGLRSRLLDGVGGLLKSQADLATSQDAFIAVSFRPYSPQVVDIVVETSERGIPVIAITDSALSPLALESNVTFEVRDNEQQAFRTLIAPMCLAQSLIVQLGHELAGKNGKSR